ncbi:MAG: hypothetical protein NE327_04710 [Lentisphaeraceae bacterium]|nr:hypothetical protein [Lentisphaeraceae bacterium]
MNIAKLKNKHFGQPAFCLGTAPHLNELDLSSIKNFVTIACNQLVLQAEEYNFNYVCFHRNERFALMRDKISQAPETTCIVPKDVLQKNEDWECPKSVEGRIVEIKNRFTASGYADYFSFDLKKCFFSGSVIGLEIQLAVWMGCNPIYVVGVDSSYKGERMYYTGSPNLKTDIKTANNFNLPDQSEWLAKVHTLLKARGISLLNAAGEFSSLKVLPKIRFGAVTDEPLICVTSKTFSQDEFLVNKLKRYFPKVRLNTSKDKLSGDSLVKFLKDADGVILGTEKLEKCVIDQLPFLRYVVKYGVGLNNIDFEAAEEQNMKVIFKKGVNSDSVAELTLALSLMLMRNIDSSITAYKNKKWAKIPGVELAEMTVGVIGYGHVGKVVSQKFAALGAGRLLVHDIRDIQPEEPAESVSLDFLLKTSDIVTVHISMERGNFHLVNKKFLDKMKESAYLINTSRGEVICEDDLVDALQKSVIKGAALDVFENEPVPNKKLIECNNILTTCHIAGSSNRAIKNMGWASIEGMLNLFNREPV